MGQRLTDWIATMVVLAIVPVMVFVTSTAALAARPSSSVWISETTTGQRVTMTLGAHFTVGYATREREPWALAECRPNASTVYTATYDDGTVWSEVFSVYPNGPTPQNFVLGESVYPLWTAGGADCTVTLLKFSPDLSRRTVLATAEFAATP